MVGQEFLFRGGDDALLIMNGITQGFNPFCDLLAGGVAAIDAEAYITTGQAHFYIRHAFFFKKLVDGECAVRTGHAFNFPIHCFHLLAGF